MSIKNSPARKTAGTTDEPDYRQPVREAVLSAPASDPLPSFAEFRAINDAAEDTAWRLVEPEVRN